MTISTSTGRTALAVGLTTAALVASLRAGAPAPKPVASPIMAANPQVQVRQEIGTFAKLAKILKPSVVNIAVEKLAQSPDNLRDLRELVPGYSPSQDQPRARGQGSGVIISGDGYIMTNNHVVSDATNVKVTLSDGREMPAKVIGTDPKTDLALVKVEGGDLPAAALGDSEALDVGDWVMAIGNPFGLDETVTVGVLSGKGRIIGAGPYDDFLQTDASINPGNSGGPLFNTDGQVVGINTAIIPKGQGIGFAIPINLAKHIVEQLKTNGHVVRGFLALGAQPLTPTLREALKLPSDTQGALVSQVVPQGPAGQAGVQIEDVITAINGKTIHSDRELMALAADLPVGQEAELKVLRQGKETTLRPLVSERPDDQQAARNELPVQDLRVHQRVLGITLVPLTETVAQQVRTDDLQGVVIAQIASGSLAQRAGLLPGDILRKVNDKPISGIEDVVTALKMQTSSSSLAFLVERQGHTHFVEIGD